VVTTVAGSDSELVINQNDVLPSRYVCYDVVQLVSMRGFGKGRQRTTRSDVRISRSHDRDGIATCRRAACPKPTLPLTLLNLS
jgi:hypothetical protein